MAASRGLITLCVRNPVFANLAVAGDGELLGGNRCASVMMRSEGPLWATQLPGSRRAHAELVRYTPPKWRRPIAKLLFADQ